MPEPESGSVDLGPEPVGDPAQESLLQFQGQASAGLAVRRRREREPGQAREMMDSGVAVKDSEQKQVDRGDGVQHGGAPGVADLAADVEDRGAVEFLGRVLLQAAKDANNPAMHRKASCTGCRQATPA
jgi:hypothetical protein